MAQNPNIRLKLDETELNALVRVARPKLFKHMADIAGLNQSRTLINGGNNYAGLREYSPGDEVRAINWRASARSRQYQVHQHQQEKSGRWYICVDISASMSLPTPDKWWLAMQLADAFAYILLACGNQLGFLAFSDKVNEYCSLGLGRNQYKKVHQSLQRLSPETKGGDSLLQSCLSHVKQQASVIVISDFLPPDHMKHGMDRLRKAGHYLHALRVLSKEETRLPATETAVIVDIETDEPLCLELTEQTQVLARTMLLQQNKELEAYCKEHRFAYSFASSDQYWKIVILNHVSSL